MLEKDTLLLPSAIDRIPLLNTVFKDETIRGQSLREMVSVFFSAVQDSNSPSGQKIDLDNSPCSVSGNPGWLQDFNCSVTNVDGTLSGGHLQIIDTINSLKLRHFTNRFDAISLSIYRHFSGEYAGIAVTSGTAVRSYLIPADSDGLLSCTEVNGLDSFNCTNSDIKSGLYQHFLRRDELAHRLLEEQDEGQSYLDSSVLCNVGIFVGILLIPTVVKLGLIAYRTFVQKEKRDLWTP